MDLHVHFYFSTICSLACLMHTAHSTTENRPCHLKAMRNYNYTFLKRSTNSLPSFHVFIFLKFLVRKVERGECDILYEEGITFEKVPVCGF